MRTGSLVLRVGSFGHLDMGMTTLGGKTCANVLKVTGAIEHQTVAPCKVRCPDNSSNPLT